MTSPLQWYKAQLASEALLPDEAQHAVVLELERIHTALLAAPPPTQARTGLGRFIAHFFQPKGEPHVIQGLYLWGGVGRGKTLLTDTFFDLAPITRKKRMHFHHFMKMIHDQLKTLTNREDPLVLIADQWIQETRLLVLDEMHVNDITDAMLLGRLLTAMFERGMTLVTTSNVTPDDLYKGGLQRDRFIPAIEQIKHHTIVFSMEGDTDYRLRVLANADIYFDAVNNESDRALQHFFERLVRVKSTADPEHTVKPVTLSINDRPMQAVREADGVVWFEFDELCNTPRSTHDYIEIATLYHTVLISAIPVLDDNRNDEARRLVNLIDELYDRHVNVVVSAEAAPEDLYVGQRLSFEFERAASRLREMQTQEYLTTGRHEWLSD